MFSLKNANDLKSKTKMNVERKFNFAKLYYLYKEYDAAFEHICDYLRHKEDSACGHKLLAQIYEAIGEGDKALKSYQKSLECDSNQSDLLLRICKLLIVHPDDSDTMRFWMEKAEKMFPKHDAVVQLKEFIEDSERSMNGNENVTFNDSNAHNYSYYLTPLSERFSSPKLNSKNQLNVNRDRVDERLSLIIKKQEELLRNVCDRQDLLLKSNEAIVAAIKEGNNNFVHLQVKLDKITSTLEEIYVLKNLSFSKKQDNNENVDVSYNHLNSSYSQFENVTNESLSNTTEWQKSQEGEGFAIKFKNCDISEAFQKAIRGAKGFNDSSNSTQSFTEWPSVNAPEESFLNEAKNEIAQRSFGTVRGNELFPNSTDTAASIYPQTLFSTIPKSTEGENPIVTSAATAAANTIPDTRPLSELFRSQNKWQCPCCYVQNDEINELCLACEQPRPGTSILPSTDNKNVSFNFGISYNPENSSNNASQVVKFGLSPKAGTTFGFNFGEDSTVPSPKAFSFAAAIKDAQQPTFHFGSSQNFSFKFGGVSSSPVSNKSPKQSQETPNSPEDYQESPDHSTDDSFHFKPLIPLPPKVEVKTGEEDETVLFNERAKLYRYVNGEWKERGIGDIKILEDNINHHCRLLMRRDQVLKVCLNHQITKDMQLIPKGNANDDGGVKSFQWSATDYSESVPNSEVFAIKFKNSIIAEMFRKTFEDAKLLLNDRAENLDLELEIVYEKTPTPEILEKVKQYHLPLNFYDYENAEPCIGCRGCSDDIPKLKCEMQRSHACDPDPSDTINCKIDLFSAALAEQGAVSGWSTNPQSIASWVTDKPKPVFNTPTDDATDEPLDSNNASDFKPVIPLPDLVEVKTGEEDESIFFSQRAKLYRYDVISKQWKERGVGEFKILKHDAKRRFRLLLRRDQVLKIACNHYVCKELQFTPMSNSENAVCWSALDYSEEVAVPEKFAVKFKNKSILNEFLTKIEEAKNIFE